LIHETRKRPIHRSRIVDCAGFAARRYHRLQPQQRSYRKRVPSRNYENMLGYMHDGKNPIGDFEGRIRGKDAVEFAENLA